MTQAKPIKATYSDFRLVKGRKVCQLVFEVSIEAADAALTALGGLPRPDAERWYAIVALDLPNASRGPRSEPEKERKPFETLAAAQQAALRCNDFNFQKFLRAHDADDAAMIVRDQCGVKSRSELATNPTAAHAWRELEDSFLKWQRGFR